MAAVANDHKLHDLKQQKCVSSQLLRMGVQEQDVIGPRLSLKALGENPALPLLVSFFFWPHWVFIAVHGLLLLQLEGLAAPQLCDLKFPDQILNLNPLHCKVGS